VSGRAGWTPQVIGFFISLLDRESIILFLATW